MSGYASVPVCPDCERVKGDCFCDGHFCPDCFTELSQHAGRRRGSRTGWWCWKCERFWKMGLSRTRAMWKERVGFPKGNDDS